jgi:prefoldin subunit 5
VRQLLLNGIWSFNPVIKNLVNYLNLSESRSSRNLEIPEVSQSESRVSRIYSPITMRGNATVFSVGGSIFEANEDEITKLTQRQIARVSPDYLNLVSVFNSEGVKVNENGVFVRLGRKSVRLVEENSDISVYLDNSKLNFKTLGELGKLLGLEVGSYLGVNENEAINKVITIHRGFSDIVELDFAKSIISNIYEGVSANLFKWNGRIYVNRINEGMRENSFFQVNGTQAVNTIREFLKYDISEGLTEFLEGEYKVKSIMINDRNKILENISKVEGEIAKIENLMETNQLYSSSKEIKAAHNLLNRELNLLKEKWNQINLELNKIEMTPEDDSNLMEDERFNIGSYVKIKESGESGKIVSIDGTSGRYTVLLDSGKTSEYLVNEIVDLDSALNQAANDNEESDRSDDDSEEEMKESMTPNTLNKSKLSIEEQKKILKGLSTNHSFANAPKGEQEEIDMDMDGFHGYNLTMNEEIKKIQSKYRNGQMVKAPGDSKIVKGKDANKKNLYEAPGSGKTVKGKVHGKDLLGDEAPGKSGNVDFEGNDGVSSDYEIGYNVKEGKMIPTNYAKVPNGGSKASMTKSVDPNKTLVDAPESGKSASETYRPSLMNSLISAPDHGKKAKETNPANTGIMKRQGLVSAPGKEGDVNYKSNNKSGYNLSEAEDLKKK